MARLLERAVATVDGCNSAPRWIFTAIIPLIFFLLFLQAAIVYTIYFGSSTRFSAQNVTILRKNESLPILTIDIQPRGNHTAVRSSLNATTSDTGKHARTHEHSRSTSLLTWKKGSFCYDFIERQFYEPVAVCASRLHPNHSIGCHRTPKSAHMIQCTVQNVALLGPRVPRENARYTLLQGEKHCPNPSWAGVQKSTEGGDPIREIVKKLVLKKPLPILVCQKWINKTAFMYFGKQNVHVYFRFNAYFNLHKAIQNEGVAPKNYVIIRLSHLPYLFSEWEKKLFPELITAHDLANATVCFRRVIFVAQSFASVLFRCKMESNIMNKCYNCKGRNLNGTSLYSFRKRVLSSCGLIDSKMQVGKKLIFISRRPYERWKADKPEYFERVLTNEGELMESVRKTFPGTIVTVAHMEKLDICTQIRLVHEADVLMGVHGAGLVHLWWLQKHAMVLELNPTYEAANPTFKMLSTLTGTNYRSLSVRTGTKHSVSVKVKDVIAVLRTYSHLT